MAISFTHFRGSGGDDKEPIMQSLYNLQRKLDQSTNVSCIHCTITFTYILVAYIFLNLDSFDA